MTSRELFIETFKSEAPAFERVLKALPKKGLDYRPHPKSKSALELASIWAHEPMGMHAILETGILDSGNQPHGKMDSISKITSAFKKSIEMVGKKATLTSDVDWGKPAKMVMGGKAVWTSTRGGMAWGLLLDWIHHRGQLSTYLRPMGGKVPSIYGPSGDSK